MVSNHPPFSACGACYHREGDWDLYLIGALAFVGREPDLINYDPKNESATMGLKEIRTALKVDLDKPASQQPGLHVSSVHQAPEYLIADPLRTDGTQIVCQSTFKDPNALLTSELPSPCPW